MLLISGMIICPTFCSKVILLIILFIKIELSGSTHSLASDQLTSADVKAQKKTKKNNFFIKFYPRVI